MPTKKDIFVIMPFSRTATCTESQWQEIYENVFRPGIEECGYSCERAASSTGSLIRSIIEKLRYSRIVLADITDRNPNVFYELGVRHSLSKRTIIVAQGDSHVPSDLSGYWYTSYGTTPGGVAQFRRDIKRLITQIENAPDRSDSPVSDYLEQENLSVSSYVQKETVKKLGALYTEFTGNLLQLTALLGGQVFDVHVAQDCLGLLLQTLYVDIGPELLKVAYELSYKLRNIERGRRDREFIEATIEDLTSLSTDILTIRTKLMTGQYDEPASVSTMIWRPGQGARGFTMVDDTCTNVTKSAVRDFLQFFGEHVKDLPREPIMISRNCALLDLTKESEPLLTLKCLDRRRTVVDTLSDSEILRRKDRQRAGYGLPTKISAKSVSSVKKKKLRTRRK